MSEDGSAIDDNVDSPDAVLTVLSVKYKVSLLC